MDPVQISIVVYMLVLVVAALIGWVWQLAKRARHWQRLVSTAGSEEHAIFLVEKLEKKHQQFFDERIARGMAMESFIPSGTKRQAARMTEPDSETMCHCGHPFLMHRGGDSPARCQRRGCVCDEFKAVPSTSTN